MMGTRNNHWFLEVCPLLPIISGFPKVPCFRKPKHRVRVLRMNVVPSIDTLSVPNTPAELQTASGGMETHCYHCWSKTKVGQMAARLSLQRTNWLPVLLSRWCEMARLPFQFWSNSLHHVVSHAFSVFLSISPSWKSLKEAEFFLQTPWITFHQHLFILVSHVPPSTSNLNAVLSASRLSRTWSTVKHLSFRNEAASYWACHGYLTISWESCGILWKFEYESWQGCQSHLSLASIFQIWGTKAKDVLHFQPSLGRSIWHEISYGFEWVEITTELHLCF